MPSGGLDLALRVVTTATPRLSWVVPLEHSGQRQAAYEVRVSEAGDPREAGDLWASGVVQSEQNSGVAWRGAPLRPHTTARWTVRVTDEVGTVSDWAEPAVIHVGPLESADWNAEWIEFPATHSAGASIRVSGRVHAAVLHFAGSGPSRAMVNGVAVNADALDPTDSSLHRSTSRSYDVTALVGNAQTIDLAFVATLGHYRLVLERPRVIGELHLRFADGATAVLPTSGEWMHVPTTLTHDDPFYRESHGRARVATPEPVTVISDTDIAIVPNAGAPVRVVRTVAATEIAAPRSGVRVFDLGENVAGRVRVAVSNTADGQVIESVQGEKLSADGGVDTTNIRLPDDRERERQVIEWTCSGGDELISPWFAVHGFRYVEVRGLTASNEVTVAAGVLHSDVEQVGTLTTSVPKLNKLVDMAVRTQLNNLHGLPEDCPTREQSGWTGDASVSAEAALSHLDPVGTYRNWLADVALDALPGGGIPGVSPHLHGPLGGQGADPVWGSAMTEIPWQIWRVTGETWEIESLLPTMRRWADWQLGTLEDGLVKHADLSFGADWLALEQTPPVLLQTAAVAVSLRAIADLEEASGHPDAAAARRAQAATVTTAARDRLFDPVDGVWANDSQASMALALTAGFAEDSERAELQARLVAAVADRDGRLSSGFAATKSVVRALADADGGSTLLTAVLQPEQPGIGAMLVDGPGTFWETWWIDDENVGVASLDHIGLGAPFAAWVWRDVAGLRILEPGFRRFAIEPRLTSEVTSASFTRETPRGTIAVRWLINAGTFSCDLTVPVGSEAEVRVPGGGTLTFGPGVHAIERPFIAPTAIEPRRVTTREHLGETWLSDAAYSSWVPVNPAITVSVENTDVICRPVYHAPIPAPTLDVVIPDFLEGVDELLVMQQDAPLNLGAASFVFASFDTDNPGIVGRAIRIFVRLRSSDGSTVEGEARPLPIAWNRVTVDVGAWPGRTSVDRVAVGIRWTDEPDTAFGPPVPLPPSPRRFAFRLGRIGWSNGPRTY
jgi:alpha-L-rhamnosidase